MPTARPLFGISSPNVCTMVFLDDGSVIELINGQWEETAPLPRTARAVALANAEAPK